MHLKKFDVNLFEKSIANKTRDQLFIKSFFCCFELYLLINEGSSNILEVFFYDFKFYCFNGFATILNNR